MGPLGVLFITMGVEVEAMLAAATVVTIDSLLAVAFVIDGAGSSEESPSEARDVMRGPADESSVDDEEEDRK